MDAGIAVGSGLVAGPADAGFRAIGRGGGQAAERIGIIGDRPAVECIEQAGDVGGRCFDLCGTRGDVL